MGDRLVRLVMPHQLFEQHLRAAAGTVFVLVEHDLLFRQYAFHRHKLILHRASMRRFADRLRDAGYDVEQVDSDGRTTSRAATAKVLARLRPTRLAAYDVVDDWLAQDLEATAEDVGLQVEWRDTPNFLTTRAQVREQVGDGGARMQHFYSWQRRRLDVLVEGDGAPVGGRWSFDEENRKKLPKDHPVPEVPWPERHPAVEEAATWVDEHFPGAPGRSATFAWPTDHAEARASYRAFLRDRLATFGPYEDAISAQHPFVFHSVMTPALNIGLLDPRDVLAQALAVDDVPLASLEGFVRQLIGWREYMRATYVVHGRRMRTRNHLRHTRPLAPGWWTGETGLDPVDLVIGRVLERGWAHHIERLMVLGNAMCLLRTDPEAVYEWFMEMFVDAYDWVMVPNVHAMSQFAAGGLVTTKPYVSGSNYLRKMSDLPAGDWTADWDALYWTFVRDHHDVFARNPRASVIARGYDGLAPATKAAHTKRATRWLED
ncbi:MULTISPECIES: cryptochrome/photolyase family protein [unclassified Nocardioides]|uniref:cryptochrome/photolyase family protein n=1 Tax=unclassified Nocardioides TaxID=2615069 RepID=UPI0030151864